MKENKMTEAKITGSKAIRLAERVKTHVKQASVEARADMANGRWDEVMTDALYTDCGAQTVDDMDDARRIAEIAAKELMHSLA